LPLGLIANGNFTCATCHAVLNKAGQRLKGVPNGDLGISLSLAPNTAAGFARLNIDPSLLYTKAMAKQSLIVIII